MHPASYVLHRTSKVVSPHQGELEDEVREGERDGWGRAPLRVGWGLGAGGGRWRAGEVSVTGVRDALMHGILRGGP